MIKINRTKFIKFSGIGISTIAIFIFSGLGGSISHSNYDDNSNIQLNSSNLTEEKNDSYSIDNSDFKITDLTNYDSEWWYQYSFLIEIDDSLKVIKEVEIYHDTNYDGEIDKDDTLLETITHSWSGSDVYEFFYIDWGVFANYGVYNSLIFSAIDSDGGILHNFQYDFLSPSVDELKMIGLEEASYYDVSSDDYYDFVDNFEELGYEYSNDNFYYLPLYYGESNYSNPLVYTPDFTNMFILDSEGNKIYADEIIKFSTDYAIFYAGVFDYEKVNEYSYFAGYEVINLEDDIEEISQSQYSGPFYVEIEKNKPNTLLISLLVTIGSFAFVALITAVVMILRKKRIIA